MFHPADNPVQDPDLTRRRQTALRRFVVQRLATGFSRRAAFALGVAIALGFAFWMLALFYTARVDVVHVLAIRGIRWICMVAGGLVTLGLATDVRARDAAEGVTMLLGLRGYEEPAIQRAYLHATVRLIARTLLVPTVALSLLAVVLSQSATAALGRLLLTLGVAGFVLLLSVVLAACARGAVALDRRRSRWILVALLAGPEVFLSFGGDIAGIPSLFAALLDHVATLGVAFG